jgi:hypothetical protein
MGKANVCPKCGGRLRMESKYCGKCGNINIFKAKPLGIKKIILLAFNTGLENYWILASIYIIGVLPIMVLMTFLPGMLSEPGHVWLFFIFEVLFGIIATYAYVAETFAAAAFLKKKKISVIMAYKNSLPKLWTYLVAILLAVMACYMGFLLFIIPGIYWGTRLIFTGTAAILEESGTKPLQMSRELTKGYFWKIFILLAVFILIMAVPSLVILSRSGQKLLLSPVYIILSTLFGVVFTPFITVFIVAFYQKLRVIKKRELKTKQVKSAISGNNNVTGCLLSLALFAGVIVLYIIGSVIFYGVMKGNGLRGKQADNFNKIPVSVIVNTINAKKISFIKTEEDCHIHGINQFKLSGKNTIGFVSCGEAVFTDNNGRPVKKIKFMSQYRNKIDIVDMSNDGKPEFLCRGSWAEPAVLIGEDGREIWKYDDKNGIDDSEAGDLYGDGKKEIVVTMNGGGGIKLFDVNKGEIWKKDGGNIWSVAIRDINNDGENEIIHTSANGSIYIRDKDGNVLKENKTVDYLAHFSMTNWFDRDDSVYPVSGQYGKIEIYNINGTTAAEFKTSDIQNPHYISTTIIKGRNKYLAAVLSEVSQDNSMLYIFDEKGTVLYEEKTQGEYLAIMAFKSGFLAGGKGEVFYYKIKD